MKFKLDPNAEQAVAIERNSEICGLINNVALEQRSNWYRQFRRVAGVGISVACQYRELAALRVEEDGADASTQPFTAAVALRTVMRVPTA